jgi:hypothetical protein
VEWIWGVILMTNEDKEDCLELLMIMKETCAVFLKQNKGNCEHLRTNDVITTGFARSMDMSIDVLIEIIENKPLEIKRMF